jgi:hypothetical protein
MMTMLSSLLTLSLICVVYALEVPTSPYLDLSVLSGNTIRAEFTPPLSDGGSSINSYKVDWDTDPGVHEVQMITTSTYIGANTIQSVTTSIPDVNERQIVAMTANAVREIQEVSVTGATAGYFFLELDTSDVGGSLQFSGYISHDFSASDVQTIMNSMSNIGSGCEVTKEDIADGFKYLITFPETMGNVPPMSVWATELEPGAATASVATTSEGNVVSGTFKLEYQSEITEEIPFDASESVVRQRLEALSTIETVEVTRSNVDSQNCYRWTVEFTGKMNDGDLNDLVPDFTGLDVSNAAGVANVAVQQPIPGS